MRKLLFIVCAVLVACAVQAEPKAIYLSVPMGTNATVTSTFAPTGGFKGSVDTIYVSCTDGASASTVTVYRASVDTNVTDETMATATVTGNKVFRPRVDATDTAGSGLTSDPPVRFLLCDESVKVKVENSATGKTWRVTIKAE